MIKPSKVRGTAKFGPCSNGLQNHLCQCESGIECQFLTLAYAHKSFHPTPSLPVTKQWMHCLKAPHLGTWRLEGQSCKPAQAGAPMLHQRFDICVLDRARFDSELPQHREFTWICRSHTIHAVCHTVFHTVCHRMSDPATPRTGLIEVLCLAFEEHKALHRRDLQPRNLAQVHGANQGLSDCSDSIVSKKCKQCKPWCWSHSMFNDMELYFPK